MADFEAPDREAPEFWVTFGANFTIGNVETLEPGSDAYVENVGTERNQVWNIGIPKGEKGDTGTIVIRRL